MAPGLFPLPVVAEGNSFHGPAGRWLSSSVGLLVLGSQAGPALVEGTLGQWMSPASQRSDSYSTFPRERADSPYRFSAREVDLFSKTQRLCLLTESSVSVRNQNKMNSGSYIFAVKSPKMHLVLYKLLVFIYFEQWAYQFTFPILQEIFSFKEMF